MKILLIGEASSLHLNLKKGLIECNHDVTLVSSGDGFKKISSDIVLKRGKSKAGSLYYYYQLASLIINFRNFDVVQLISTDFFPSKFRLDRMLIKILKQRNQKIFIVGAGCIDTYTCDFFQNTYKYKEFYKAIKSHYKVDRLFGQTTKGREFSKWLFNEINGYIPIMYEYAEGHRNVSHDKLTATIPIPIKLEDFRYEKNTVEDKVIIFHGISRREVKGTDFILKELNKLKDAFPDRVELLIVEKVSYSNYLKLLQKANIVVDQLYSVSTGVNGLISMALGKVTIGGGEKEFLKEFSLDKSPLIPIRKEVDNIFNILSELIHNKDEISRLGMESRTFIEKNHDAVKIAKKYINIWNEN